MSLEAYFALGVVAAVTLSLMLTKLGADLVFMTGLVLLMLAGVLSPEAALAGFSNQGMITVAALYVVVVGLRETGSLNWLSQQLLGRPKSVLNAQTRIMLPVTLLSAFINNTPVVAMLIPAVNDLAKRASIAPSKLMIPLSYAAIFGGSLTLVGSSTNLVVNGLVIRELGQSLRFFELALIGLPVAIVGLSFVLLTSRWLLPERQSPLTLFRNPREYTVEMQVYAGSPIIGKSIERAGLRHLPGLYLAEIERRGQSIPAVSPSETLQENDRLIFVGIIESVLELQKIRGLEVATDQVFKLDAPRHERVFTEAVVSASCPLVGKSIRDGQFRTVYNAVIIAVARGGERLSQKIGDIILKSGDTLLLEARPNFALQQRNAGDFLLVSSHLDAAPLRHERAGVALMILLGMVLLVATGLTSMLYASLLAAVLMVLSGCCTAAEARQGIDWQVLVVIAASFGLGTALEASGAANAIAESLLTWAGPSPHFNLGLIYLMTTLFTAFITNNAAAVIVFPIALTLAETLAVNPIPFIIAIMLAASASFATPIGYQTNLMVYGPGGYQFRDYLRIGLPLSLILGVLTIALIPLIWRF